MARDTQARIGQICGKKGSSYGFRRERTYQLHAGSQSAQKSQTSQYCRIQGKFPDTILVDHHHGILRSWRLGLSYQKEIVKG